MFKYLFSVPCVDVKEGLFVRKRLLHKGYQLLKADSNGVPCCGDEYSEGLLTFTLIGNFDYLSSIEAYCSNVYNIDIKL